MVTWRMISATIIFKLVNYCFIELGDFLKINRRCSMREKTWTLM